MSDRETPLTDAVNSGEWDSLEIRYDLMHDFAEDLERKLAELTERWEKAANAYLIEKGKHEATQAKLDEAREALEKIEERYVNGHDTYADHEFMGETAQQALARIDGNASAVTVADPNPKPSNKDGN